MEPWLPTAGRFEESERARERLEAALSFAATVCGEWCKRNQGNRILLAVAGPADPVIVEGAAAPALESLLLECLAVVSGGPIAEGRLADGLAARLLPRGPILLVSTRAPGLAEDVSRRLGRGVVGLGVAELS